MKKVATLTDFFAQKGVLQVLNPVLAAQAIQGYRDEITPAARADAAYYNQFTCPTCKSEMRQEFLGGARGAGVTWRGGSATAQALLRCLTCRLLLSPHTGLIIEPGDHAPVAPVGLGPQKPNL